jgi:hypothetical protein
MIGHPSGDEPLMVDVRQSGSGPLLRDPQKRSMVRKEMRAHLRKQP